MIKAMPKESRIKKAFENGKAFIPFITCGDPDLETTEKLVYAMERAGADLIELGIPFSDPTAEGPVIQSANVRALSGGVTTDKIFEMLKRIRKKSTVPLAFMTYANVVFSYGTVKFISKAAEYGIDALILPDVPFEEKGEFEPVCKRCGIDFISLVTPVSGERARMIAKSASGFIYCVSSLGVTGQRNKIGGAIGDVIADIKTVTDLPCAVGFGVSTPQQAKTVSKFADGVIVGSAIVDLCAKHGTDCVVYVEKFVREMKRACR